MVQLIEPETAPRDPLGVVTRILVAQAFALDRMFFRAAKESALDDMSNRHMRKALKAQDRCRATFKILLALGAVKRHPEKFSNLTEGTIQTLKIPVSPMSYAGAKRPATPLRAHPTHKKLGVRKRWTPERRARQAAAIREWQPWRNSSGPKTPEGKARSARNALKHGHKAKAYVEMLREDRRILRLAASNIAIAKACLRGVPARPITLLFHLPLVGRWNRRSAKARGGSGLPCRSCEAAKAGGGIVRAPAGCSLSPNWYWPRAPLAGTFRPQILGESRSFRPLAGRQRGPATTMEARAS